MYILVDCIYNEDCLEGMNKIPDGSVDMVLCDPPYGTTDNAWDRRLPFEPMWRQFCRVTKHNAAIVLFSQLPFGAELIMSNRKMFRYEWIWEKYMAVGFLNAKKMPLRCHENILVFYRSLPTYNPQWGQGEPYTKRIRRRPRREGCYGPTRQCSSDWESDGRRYPRDVLKGNVMRGFQFRTNHPTEKPVSILEYLIRTYTDEGELVLDACLGSGSTAVAAVNTGRHFIGFETEAKYYETATRRIDEAQRLAAQRLF